MTYVFGPEEVLSIAESEQKGRRNGWAAQPGTRQVSSCEVLNLHPVNVLEKFLNWLVCRGCCAIDNNKTTSAFS